MWGGKSSEEGNRVVLGLWGRGRERERNQGKRREIEWCWESGGGKSSGAGSLVEGKGNQVMLGLWGRGRKGEERYKGNLRVSGLWGKRMRRQVNPMNERRGEERRGKSDSLISPRKSGKNIEMETRKIIRRSDTYQREASERVAVSLSLRRPLIELIVISAAVLGTGGRLVGGRASGRAGRMYDSP